MFGMFGLDDAIKLVTVVHTLILLVVLVVTLIRKRGRPLYLKIMYGIEALLLLASVALMT